MSKLIILTAAGLNYATAKLETLNKKADKCGLPRVELHVTKELWRVYRNPVTGNERAMFRPGIDAGYLPTDRHEERYLVTVHGDAPVLAGYQVVARLDHLSEGNIINKAPSVSEESLPTVWRHTAATCQHCLQTRRRNSTFLLEGPDGVKQIGRNCLADYVRDSKAAEAIVGWAAYIRGVEDTIREAEGRSGGGKLYYTPELLVRASILCSDHFGWVSAAQAQNDPGLIPTKSHVLGILSPPWKEEPVEYAGLRRELAEGARQDEATAVARWVNETLANREENELNDYLSNLVVAFGQSALEAKYAGLVCSAFRAHRREQAQIEEQHRAVATAEALPPSKHVGTVGQRSRGIPARVTFIKSLGLTEAYWGGGQVERFLCKFETIPDGDVLVWFTGEGLKYNEGDMVMIDAGVKEHVEYNGRKQTIVQRVSDSKEKSRGKA